MKTIIRLLVVASLVFVLSNEPPRQQAVAEVVNPVVVEAVIETPTPVTPPPTPKPEVSMTKQQIMTAAGIPESEWAAVDYILTKESNWRHLAVNKSSGATGICQSLPASKMASAGSDYLTNPVTQMKWCNSYAKSRYGGWWAAHSFWISNRWW